MGEWKALKRASGTGWKELEREAGTGWKALLYETTAYEDFTTFTEVDIGADRIQKTANHIDHLAYRNEDTYLYKDYGVDHFGNFTHKNKIRIVSAGTNTDGWGIVWGLSDNIDDVQAWTLGVYLFVRKITGGYQLYIREKYSGTAYSSGCYINADTWYYVKSVKSGTAFNGYVYSDSDYSVLVDSVSLTLHADHTLRYLYGCNTINIGDYYNAQTDIENFDIGE